jgi:glycosyltransferase involved in cell wall biosynthesis
MGPGRLLGDLLAAVERSVGASLTIRVTGADLAAYRALVASRGLDDRVEVAEPVPPDGLVAALRGFDVGLIINRPVTRNDELVLPNKLFEYLMAGLAVAVPNLPSVGALVEREGVGLTVPPADPAALGGALSRLAGDRELLARLRARARVVALEQYNAEAQAHQLARAWGVR